MKICIWAIKFSLCIIFFIPISIQLWWHYSVPQNFHKIFIWHFYLSRLFDHIHSFQSGTQYIYIYFHSYMAYNKNYSKLAGNASYEMRWSSMRIKIGLPIQNTLTFNSERVHIRWRKLYAMVRNFTPTWNINKYLPIWSEHKMPKHFSFWTDLFCVCVCVCFCVRTHWV